MPSLNRYFYEPLSAQDAVRLIVLYPATDQEAPLTCSIIQHRLSTQALGYYAVSYAWGKHQFSATLEIKCDGTSSSSLRITPNVDALLRCLRASDETRCWWIDAICLDQENDTEKAEQIPARGRIFAQAQQVHIWLGPEDEVTVKIFKFFRKVSQLPDMDQAEMERRVTILMIYKICRTGIRDRGRVAEFFNLSWFSRRWVIQEACLAREAIFHCGRYPSSLPLLSLAATRIQNKDIASYPIKMMANLRRPLIELSILELLWNFHDAICLEPKDRVAALFGHVQVAVSAFSSNNNDVGLQVLLHLFEFGQVFEQDNASYPSWVPDWRKSRRRLLPYNSRVKGTDTHENYPASPGQSEKAILNFQDNTLQVHWNASTGGPRGRRVIFARTFNSLPHDAGYKPKRVVYILQELFPPLSDSIQDFITLSYLLKTIVLFRKNTEDWRLNNKAFDRYMRMLQEMLSKSSSSSGAETFTYLRTLDFLLQDYCLLELEPFNESGRSFGIGPKAAETGDAMIPLWRLGWQPKAGGSRRMIAMLVVRPIKDHSPSGNTSMLEGEGSIPQGRILGPAVCVVSGSPCGDEYDRSFGVGKEPNLSLMYLI
ncbi:hypothetical protein NW761_014962 [Fusarium oxysporum]|nr:hypothetical protein NW758_014774 [Fusarium oxysporum]WKT53559.1 Heterokaryon incompatibility [Fusarium oxysporum f. sp. vasinfectum]KAJ4029268.1 hypothetical protein NW753_014270 [Fusarium oxysporum]KAJ4032969.1 hypothetical protein NW763_014459 [Fusarium oxysporum]KAJ4072411.1 hypothetical protein NW761_014962 [Fusarium oxysporum]